MFDPVTLDQLRAFVTIAEEGSFSAAARKLKRVQSAISTATGNLEKQLGVRLWDRTTKIPTLTPSGEAVLASARRVLLEVSSLRRVTEGLVLGVEAHVSLCVEALFPLDALIELCAKFANAFPTVDLRVSTEVMSSVSARVRNGAATLGIVAVPGLLPGLDKVPLTSVQMIPVVAASHDLAMVKGTISLVKLADTVQIVLSERAEEGLPDQGVLSLRTWRVADLHTKHAMLRKGLGWGNLPEPMVRGDLARGNLVMIRPHGWNRDQTRIPMFAVYRSDTFVGPAHAWLLTELPQLCPEGRNGETAAAKPATRHKGTRARSISR